jgi:mRNA-degrading endonuclease toxin of MazEF toxin-antitoxin module
VTRGSIIWVNLEDTHPPEMGKTRPAIVVSNSEQNQVLNTIVVIPLSSRAPAIWPLRVEVPASSTNRKKSFAIIPAIHRAAVATKTPQHIRAQDRALLLHIGQHGIPQGMPALALAFCQSRHAVVVRAQRHAEHVGDDLVAHPLLFQLTCQIDEHLIGDMRERRSPPGCGGQRGDQHRRLAHDRIDQQRCAHANPRVIMGAKWIGPGLLLVGLVAAPGCGDDEPSDGPNAGERNAGAGGRKADAGNAGTAGRAGAGGSAGAAGRAGDSAAGRAGAGGQSGAAAEACARAVAAVTASLDRWHELSAAEGSTYWYAEEYCAPNMPAGRVTTVQVDASGPSQRYAVEIPNSQCEAQVNRYEFLPPSTFEQRCMRYARHSSCASATPRSSSTDAASS